MSLKAHDQLAEDPTDRNLRAAGLPRGREAVGIEGFSVLEGLRWCSICRKSRGRRAPQTAPKDGIMMDLGVSSPQLDDRARGFSVTQELWRGGPDSRSLGSPQACKA